MSTYIDRFHGSALHADLFAAGCEAHRNFADESESLTADDIQNKVVTTHR
jgi:hypothetical protein